MTWGLDVWGEQVVTYRRGLRVLGKESHLVKEQ
jgi:hypothetical protein